MQHQRFTWSGRAVALLAVLVAVATAAAAQSLGEVARKEAERRKAITTQGKIYTNQDLGPAAIRSGPVVLATPAVEALSPPTPVPPAPDEEVKDEKYWRDRITQARDGLARAEVLRAALDSRLNALEFDFVNQDDPARRAVIAQDRQNARVEMERMDEDIERMKKEITDIQDEARKAGVPPGWLR